MGPPIESFDTRVGSTPLARSARCVASAPPRGAPPAAIRLVCGRCAGALSQHSGRPSCARAHDPGRDRAPARLSRERSLQTCDRSTLIEVHRVKMALRMYERQIEHRATNKMDKQ
jgi:hypothetical protein